MCHIDTCIKFPYTLLAKNFEIGKFKSSEGIWKICKKNYYFFFLVVGVRGQHEGLVHISQLRREGRVKEVSEVVRKGQRVKVKVLGITGGKMSLSMKVSVYVCVSVPV